MIMILFYYEMIMTRGKTEQASLQLSPTNPKHVSTSYLASSGSLSH